MASSRHRWIRLREHVYICCACGMGKQNLQDRTGGWYVAWFLPDGAKTHAAATPACAPGRTTEKRLQHYAAVIASGGVRKTDGTAAES